jgi:hypothetical protein
VRSNTGLEEEEEVIIFLLKIPFFQKWYSFEI